MKQTIKNTVLLLVAGSTTIAVNGELGVGFGSSFNYKASFKSAGIVTPYANDPGAATAGVDHEYDDGFNRLDSTGNSDRGTGTTLTTYWGYQNASQYDASGSGTLTMNSARTLVDATETRASSDAAPVIEVFWNKDFSQNERWNYGMRVALRWQKVKVESSAASSTTTETTSDVYQLNGVISPGAPYTGAYTGPLPVLGDTPSRSVNTTGGTSYMASRSIDGNMLGLDFGPTFSFNISERLKAVGSLGGTAARIHSTFQYDDGIHASGSSSDKELLFGAFAGADVHYRIGEKWGIFGGASMNWLETFSQQGGGHRAELDFDDSYTVRLGVFTQL